MRKLFILLCLLLVISACAKGGTLKARVIESEQPTEESKQSDVSEPKQESSADVTAPEDDEDVLGDIEVPDYSEFKGTCEEDSVGVVRVFDEAGKKAVHRNTCFGNKLIDYSCKGNVLDSEFKVCQRGCEVVTGRGKCV